MRTSQSELCHTLSHVRDGFGLRMRIDLAKSSYAVEVEVEQEWKWNYMIDN